MNAMTRPARQLTYAMQISLKIDENDFKSALCTVCSNFQAGFAITGTYFQQVEINSPWQHPQLTWRNILFQQLLCFPLDQQPIEWLKTQIINNINNRAVYSQCLLDVISFGLKIGNLKNLKKVWHAFSLSFHKVCLTGNPWFKNWIHFDEI